MRGHTSNLLSVLSEGSFDWRLIVDVFQGTDRALQNLTVTNFSLDWSYSTVGLSGHLEVTHPVDDGVSLIPVGPRGVLSPHAGAQVLLLAEVTAGGFQETVQLGWARITGFSDARDSIATLHDGTTIVTETSLRLELQGIEIGVVRHGMQYPTQPADGGTCYSELRRLTPLPVVETLPDVPAPQITYEAAQGGRWDACIELGRHLGGTVWVDSLGNLTVHDPDVALSGTLSVGEGGTITDYEHAGDSERAYNQVVGIFEDDKGEPLYETAELADGPMGTLSAYGTNTRYYASDFVKTRAQAKSAVQAILDQSTLGRSYVVPVTAVMNPLVEVGDRWRIVQTEREIEGVIVGMRLAPGALMQIDVEVWRAW